MHKEHSIYEEEIPLEPEPVHEPVNLEKKVKPIKFKNHTVRKWDTLYFIGATYPATKEQILQANPGLTKRNLQEKYKEAHEKGESFIIKIPIIK